MKEKGVMQFETESGKIVEVNLDDFDFTMNNGGYTYLKLKGNSTPHVTWNYFKTLQSYLANHFKIMQQDERTIGFLYHDCVDRMDPDLRLINQIEKVITHDALERHPNF